MRRKISQRNIKEMKGRKAGEAVESESRWNQREMENQRELRRVGFSRRSKVRRLKS